MAKYGKGIRPYLFVLGLAVTGIAHGDWEWLNPQPQGNILADVVYGNGQYVAVGNSGTVLTSDDGGLSWERQNSGSNEWLYAIEWTGSEYVTVGDRRTVIASSDGENWQAQASGPYTYLYGVASNGSNYVAVGDSGSVLYSSDGGQRWQEGRVDWSGTSESSPWLNDVVWTGARFVAIGAGGTVITSADGVSWTSDTVPNASSLEALAWNGARLVAVGARSWDADQTPLPKIFYSDNRGASWTFARADQPTDATLNGVHWDGTTSQFIAVGDDGEILTSTDGVSWVAQGSGSQQPLEKVASGGGALIAVGEFGTILRSRNGADWDRITEGVHTALNAVAANSTRYVGVGEGGLTLAGERSTAGVPTAAQPADTALNDIAWNAGSGQFVAVGAGGTVLTGDGSASGWASAGRPTDADLHGVTVGNGQAIAVGAGGTVCQLSTQACTTESDVTLRDIGHNSNRFVAVGDGGTVLTSANGTDWRTVASGAEENLLGIAATDTGWVTVGENGTLLTSADGIGWTARDSGTSEPLRAVIWANGQLYALGGDSLAKHKEGVLLTSSDGGQTWARQSATGNDLYGLGASPRGNAVLAVGEGGTLLESQCPCATDDSATTDQRQTVTVDVLANDVGANLTISQFQQVSDRGGSVTRGGNGTLAYTPPDGFAGIDSFDYTISNGTETDVGSVQVTVNEVPGGGYGSSGSSGGGATAGYLLLGLWGLLLARRRLG